LGEAASETDIFECKFVTPFRRVLWFTYREVLGGDGTRTRWRRCGRTSVISLASRIAMFAEGVRAEPVLVEELEREEMRPAAYDGSCSH
jgi:hypothetical protein